jgi:hypothetical protein
LLRIGVAGVELAVAGVGHVGSFGQAGSFEAR